MPSLSLHVAYTEIERNQHAVTTVDIVYHLQADQRDRR